MQGGYFELTERSRIELKAMQPLYLFITRFCAQRTDFLRELESSPRDSEIGPFSSPETQ